jgi:hypothetical protein
MEKKAMQSSGICPLCGEKNLCALAAGEPQQSCWCISETFPQSLLQQSESEDQRGRCICANCLEKARRSPDAG